ncbi:MAG: hypothetical protein EXS05_06490 [Planctomycetaceae bacterium]|nr:hypothetical protein [Planctomycetaceae bacterium]
MIEAREIEDGAAAPRPTTKRRFQPIELGHSGAGPSSGSGTTSDEQQEQSIIASLQPFQILLGQWKWVTQKKIGDFPKTGDDLEWVWDFQSDKQHPALTAHSDEHPYLHQTWLTYLPVENLFQFTTEDPKGARRVLQGTWAEGGEPADESDGKTLQRTYKLHLTQIDPTDGDQWAVTFKQLDNNQYLVEYKKSPGKKKPFGQFDIVRQQRVGTSFALADSDNPGPKCIISGGLGTMSVTYQGKSYPVCCTGCQAAFNDDPERWLAKLAADEANKKKPDGVRPSHSP